MKGSKYDIIQPLLLSVVLAIGMFLGYKLSSGKSESFIKHYPKDRGITGNIEEVFRYIDAKYLYKTDVEKLRNKAVNSVIAELDMYSNYIPPKKLDYVNGRIQGNFVGIGISSYLRNDTLYILGVFEGSPAQKVGLQPMDKIVQIGNKTLGKELKGLSEIKSHFVENRGEEVDLLIVDRYDNKKTVRVSVDRVDSKSVDKDFLLPDSSVYISINQFTSHTYNEFMMALEKYVKNDTIESLVIDLRNNPGGLLQEVSKILDQFFTKSQFLLVKTVFKDGRSEEIKTTGRNFYSIKDIKVLINSNSASGSEILAGVLQDYDRGVIIGTNSFGKGLVQEQYNLRGGAALRLTTANYYLPTGRSIQKPVEVDSQFVDTKVNHYDKIDTFYSFENSRVLLSGNGIHPDIEVDDDEFRKVDYLFWVTDSLFVNWAINYINDNKDIFELSERQFIDNYEVNIDDNIKGKIENFDWYDSDMINTFLKAKIAEILYGSNAAAKIKLNVDPYIIRALRKIKTN